MRPNLDNWSTVINGNWNVNIFRPEWMGGGRLTDTQEFRIEFPVNNPALPLRYVFDDIILRISPQRLIINPQNEEADTLTRIHNIVSSILRELPHTPVSAIGVNYGFIESEPSAELLRIFEINDVVRLTDAGFVVNATSIVRKLARDGQIINLSIQFNEDNQMLFDFNFHQDVNDTNEALTFLGEGIIHFRDNALDILQTIYQLTQ